jgi:hypothetical protein
MLTVDPSHLNLQCNSIPNTRGKNVSLQVYTNLQVSNNIFISSLLKETSINFIMLLFILSTLFLFEPMFLQLLIVGIAAVNAEK